MTDNTREVWVDPNFPNQAFTRQMTEKSKKVTARVVVVQVEMLVLPGARSLVDTTLDDFHLVEDVNELVGGKLPGRVVTRVGLALDGPAVPATG